MLLKRISFSIALLFYLCHLGYGQEIRFSFQSVTGSTVNYKLGVETFLVHKKYNTEIPIDELNNKLPFFEDGDAELQIRITGGNRKAKLNSVLVNYTMEGALGSKTKEKNVKIGKKGGINISLSSSGKGSLTINVLNANFKKSDESIIVDKNTTRPSRQNFELINISDKYDPNINLAAGNKELIAEYVQLYNALELIKSYSDGWHDKIKLIQNTIATKFRDAFDRFQNASSKNPSSFVHAKELYERFGQKGFDNHPLTMTYYDKAGSQIKDVESTVWTGLSKTNSIRKVEEIYADFHSIPNYRSMIISQVRDKKIQSIINTQANTKEVCNFLENELEASKYFDKNSGNAIIIEIIKKCSKKSSIPPPPIDCKTIFNKGITSNSRSRVKRKLNSLRARNCDKKYISDLEKRLRDLTCREILEEALDEPNAKERKSLLNELLNGDCSKNIKAQAMEEFTAIPELKIDGVFYNGTTREEDDILYNYQVVFATGKDIEIIQVNDEKDSLKIFETLNWEWIEVDRTLTFKTKDKNNINLLFTSNLEETKQAVLSTEVFVAILEKGENQLTIGLKNGIAPYFAQFTNNKTSFSVRLTGPEDVIDLEELQQFYGGTYQVEIVDNNSSKGLKNPRSVTLFKPWTPDLWMILSLPVFLLTGFLAYRNWNNQLATR